MDFLDILPDMNMIQLRPVDYKRHLHHRGMDHKAVQDFLKKKKKCLLK